MMENIKIKCVAIDDEPLALIQLQNMIERTPFLSLEAACQDAFEAMRVLEEKKIDAIFVDINMPDLNGLDFVRSLNNPPIIVFTTAYCQYAIDGFKVDAIDYLLKPFGMPEFQKAAAKVKKQYELLNNKSRETALEESDTLFVKVDYRTVRISISSIEYIESQSEYIQFHLDDGSKPMVLMSAKSIAEKLPGSHFIRIHRSYIININKMKEIQRKQAKMESGAVLPISDTYKDELQQYIDSRSLGR